MFWVLYIYFIILILLALFWLRRQPIYEPRVMFVLSSILWLVIGYGYYVNYEGYLAAKIFFYAETLDVLSVKVQVLMILGFTSFILGSSVNIFFSKKKVRAGEISKYPGLMSYSCILMAIGLLNFIINVFSISNGDFINYLATTAGRIYQIEEGKGVTTIFYIFGFIGFQLFFYLKTVRAEKCFIGMVLFFIFVLVSFSQGRMFQTVVFSGSTFFVYLIAKNLYKVQANSVSYIYQIPVLAFLVILGVFFYFIRILSATYFQGIEVNSEILGTLLSNFKHYAFERGNVPNIPVVLTLVDKIQFPDDFLFGKTIFNWVLGLVPSSLLSPKDYLISFYIKDTWYLDIDGGGLPATSVGEWYANFGYLGVTVGMFIMGKVFSFFYNIMIYRNNPFYIIMWANISFGYLSVHSKVDLAQIPTFTIVFCIFLKIFYGVYLCFIRRV